MKVLVSTSVEFSVMVALDDLAAKYGMSRAEILRHAIAGLVDNEQEQGYLLSPDI